MNLCFDECIPPMWLRRVSENLFAHAKMPIQGVHLLDRLGSGADDRAVTDWLSSQDPPMMMVSGDSGRKTRGNSPRLHRLLPEAKVTSVFIAPKLCQEHGLEKVRMLIVCLPDLYRAYDGERGARYRLSKKSGGHLYQLTPW